jgi:AcrR family transcriptional regulator
MAIDHAERREKIAEIAARVIARDGLEAATVRRIAAEVGYSTTIVTHYFASKEELLLYAFRFVAKQSGERLDRVVARDPADLVGALLALTAVDESSYLGWRVYVAFWERAKFDPVFAAEQRAGIDDALKRIGIVARNRFGGREDLRTAVQMLITVVHGISVQALFDPDSWPPAQIQEALTRVVTMVLRPLGS